MNRTIKFRIWDETKKAFEYFNLYNASFLSDIKYKDIVVQQYSGLSDDNGDDIYEGDYLEMGQYTFGIVKYENGGFYFRPIEIEGVLFQIISESLPLIDFLKNFQEEGIKKNIKGNIYNFVFKPAKKIHADDLHIMNPSPYRNRYEDFPHEEQSK